MFRSGRSLALLLAVVGLAGIFALGATYLGGRGPSSHQTVAKASVPKAPPTTAILVQPAVTPSPTTLATTSPTTGSSTPAASRRKQALVDTSKPVVLPGGSFVVVSGEVTLTCVVAPGDTLWEISQWFQLMGGVTALYNWNHSTIGNNPNLIFPGQTLTMKVPGADIPKISPMYLAETEQAKADRASV